MRGVAASPLRRPRGEGNHMTPIERKALVWNGIANTMFVVGLLLLTFIILARHQ